eukprot:684618-Rhodomonas_salina.2
MVRREKVDGTVRTCKSDARNRCCRISNAGIAVFFGFVVEQTRKTTGGRPHVIARSEDGCPRTALRLRGGIGREEQSKSDRVSTRIELMPLIIFARQHLREEKKCGRLTPATDGVLGVVEVLEGDEREGWRPRRRLEVDVPSPSHTVRMRRARMHASRRRETMQERIHGENLVWFGV